MRQTRFFAFLRKEAAFYDFAGLSRVSPGKRGHLLELLISAGARVTARDKKTREQLGDIVPQLESRGVSLVLGEHYLENVAGDVVFRTPGLRPDAPALEEARARGSIVTSEMEVFFEV